MLYLQMLPSPSEKDKFEQIYTLYRGLMFYIAQRILPGEADAEDAVHQAFVSIIENLKKISEVRCPKTRSYVVIITERKAIDILRSRSRLSPEAFEESTRGVELPLPGGWRPVGCHVPAAGGLSGGAAPAVLSRLYRPGDRPHAGQKARRGAELLTRAKAALRKILEQEDGPHGKATVS